MNFTRVIWVTITCLLSVASFRVGIHYGLQQFEIVDSPGKAFMIAAHLKKIKNGKIDFIEKRLESNLTDELINYGKYLDHGKPWLFWPYDMEKFEDFFGNTRVNKEFIEEAISYRRANPIQMPYVLSNCTGEKDNEDFCKLIFKRLFYYDKAMSADSREDIGWVK